MCHRSIFAMMLYESKEGQHERNSNIIIFIECTIYRLSMLYRVSGYLSIFCYRLFTWLQILLNRDYAQTNVRYQTFFIQILPKIKKALKTSSTYSLSTYYIVYSHQGLL